MNFLGCTAIGCKRPSIKLLLRMRHFCWVAHLFQDRSFGHFVHARTNQAQETLRQQTTGLQCRSGKTTPTLCRPIIQVQLSNVNVCSLNTLIFAPTAPSRISLFGLPWPRQSSPTLSHSLSLTQSTFYPDYSTIFPHSHPVSLIRLFGDPVPHQMLPITIKYQYKVPGTTLWQGPK